MPTVYTSMGSELADGDRRESLFDGNLVVYAPRPSTLALIDLAHSTIEQMLGANPQWAQQRMSETEFAILFSGAERNFSHRHIAMELVSRVVIDFGCDAETTFINPPSLTAITGHGFLPHGLGGPQHPHRDTWFAAPSCQVNWWIPLYNLDTSSSIAFHPRYWDWPVPNSSGEFDYAVWREATSQRRSPGEEANPFAEPRPLDAIVLTPDIRIACPAGGVILSSVAQFRSTVPNDSLITYFGAHFQTVNRADLITGSGPPNVDAEPRGTSLSTSVRCVDFTPMPPDLIQRELELRRLAPTRRTEE